MKRDGNDGVEAFLLPGGNEVPNALPQIKSQTCHAAVLELMDQGLQRPLLFEVPRNNEVEDPGRLQAVKSPAIDLIRDGDDSQSGETIPADPLPPRGERHVARKADRRKRTLESSVGRRLQHTR
jgi:hypothetical protein